jgi:hypothetical protein
MKQKHEILARQERARFVVKHGLDCGLPKTPGTPLECHAFELGRLSALEWVLPPEPEEDPKPELEEEPKLNARVKAS